MKIIKLQAENVKKLKAVEITPTENTVIISGKNAAGKSSVLDAIWLALGGKDATKNTVEPIRHGESNAYVTLDLGDIIVTRTWNGSGSSLKIENKDGAVYKSPQTMLDNLMYRLSFDPLAFLRMSEKEQVQTLLSVIQSPVNIAELDEERKECYEVRTRINRGIKQYQGQMRGINFHAPGLPDTEVSISSIVTEFKHATELLENNNRLRAKLKEYETTAALIKTEIAKLEAQLERKRADLEICLTDMDNLSFTISKLVDPDPSKYQKEMEQAEDLNRKIRDNQERSRLKHQIEELQADSQRKTDRIAEIDEIKANLIRDANLPVEGLGFDETGITYKGVPFSQCSASEQWEISIALNMAAHPKCRVILIRDGSLLDRARMDVIKSMAEKYDFQVWIEVVDESGKLGVYIEDGVVA